MKPLNDIPNLAKENNAAKEDEILGGWKPMEDRLRISVFGSNWAAELHHLILNNHPEMVVYPLQETRWYCGRDEVRNLIGRVNYKTTDKMLASPELDAHTIKFKLDFYLRHSKLLLVQTDQLSNDIVHEIMVTARQHNVPTIAIGTTNPTATFAPLYIDEVWYTTDPAYLITKIKEHVAG